MIYAVIYCHIIVLIEVATILWSYYDSLFSVNSKLIFFNYYSLFFIIIVVISFTRTTYTASESSSLVTICVNESTSSIPTLVYSIQTLNGSAQGEHACS